MSASKYIFRGISFLLRNKIIIFAVVLKICTQFIASKKEFITDYEYILQLAQRVY